MVEKCLRKTVVLLSKKCHFPKNDPKRRSVALQNELESHHFQFFSIMIEVCSPHNQNNHCNSLDIAATIALENPHEVKRPSFISDDRLLDFSTSRPKKRTSFGTRLLFSMFTLIELENTQHVLTETHFSVPTTFPRSDPTRASFPQCAFFPLSTPYEKKTLMKTMAIGKQRLK